MESNLVDRVAKDELESCERSCDIDARPAQPQPNRNMMQMSQTQGVLQQLAETLAKAQAAKKGMCGAGIGSRHKSLIGTGAPSAKAVHHVVIKDCLKDAERLSSSYKLQFQYFAVVSSQSS